MNPILVFAALLGLLSVMMGALAEHALAGRVDADTLASVATAMRYHQFGALVASALGLALLFELPPSTAAKLRLAGWLFIAGVLLFSFSIYLAAFTGLSGIGRLTPLGGLCLMAGWLVLAWAGLAHRRQGKDDA